MAQAQASINSVARQLAEEYPKDNGGMKLVLTPPGLAGNFLRGPAIGFTSALFGASSLVLLVACTNLASMLLARASDRRKETAIRLALGAERSRLVRQLLTESMVVALLGGAAGALLARWITNALAGWRPPIDIPILVNVTPDYRVFLELATGRERKRTALIALKVAVLAPMPSASVRIATAANPGFCRRRRSARRRSNSIRSMAVLSQTDGEEEKLHPFGTAQDTTIHPDGSTLPPGGYSEMTKRSS